MLAVNVQLKNHAAAVNLVIEGMRIPLVHAMTGISHKQLMCVWRAIRGEDVNVPGRGVSNVLAYLKKPHNQKSHIILSTFCVMYFSIEKSHPRATQAEILLRTWQARWLVMENDEEIDINAVWYAIRDIKATELHLSKCKCCKSSFIYDLSIKEIFHCPFCSQQNLN